MMDAKGEGGRKQVKRERSELLTGAEAALRRAIETTGSVPVWKDGEIVYETEA